MFAIKKRTNVKARPPPPKKKNLHLCSVISKMVCLCVLTFLSNNSFQHVGDIETAVACLDEAQSLDTADRYINCK